MLSHRANRVVNNPEDIKKIDGADVLKAFDEMIEARKPKVTEKERKLEQLQDALRLLTDKPMEAVRPCLNTMGVQISNTLGNQMVHWQMVWISNTHLKSERPFFQNL